MSPAVKIKSRKMWIGFMVGVPWVAGSSGMFIGQDWAEERVRSVSQLCLCLGWFFSLSTLVHRYGARGFCMMSGIIPKHRENSPVTQTTPEPTLLSWGSWPREKMFPHPWPHCKPGLIALIRPLRPYCSQTLWSCSVCHGNKICSKLALTWKLTL